MQKAQNRMHNICKPSIGLLQAAYDNDINDDGGDDDGTK